MHAPGPSSGSSWTIGSASDCDLVVNQPFVSGKHCRLSLDGGQYVLEDLGSTNGTYVNGFRLERNSPVYVTAADKVTLGQNYPLPWPRSETRVERAIPGEVITIGRSPDSNIHLDFPMISWQHARISRSGNQWIIEDLKSTNGTALNQIDNKIQRAILEPSDEIYLGSYKISASQILKEKQLNKGEGAFQRVRFQGDRMILGRHPSTESPLDYPMISWHQAALERAADGIYVEDLGSRNGTYVNGVRISAKTLVRTGDEIGLGSYRF